MARHRTIRPRSGPRRKTSWLEIDPANVTVTAAGGTITHSLTTAEKAKLPFTIIRTHLTVAMVSDQSAAAEFQFGAVGAAIVSQQAETVGVSAVPTPLNELSSDYWFLHQIMTGEFNFATAVGFQQRTGAAGQYDIDSKAMRKVNEDEDVIIVVEIDSSVGSGAIFHLGGRLLIKEH